MPGHSTKVSLFGYHPADPTSSNNPPYILAATSFPSCFPNSVYSQLSVLAFAFSCFKCPSLSFLSKWCPLFKAQIKPHFSKSSSLLLLFHQPGLSLAFSNTYCSHQCLLTLSLSRTCYMAKLRFEFLGRWGGGCLSIYCQFPFSLQPVIHSLLRWLCEAKRLCFVHLCIL